MEDLDSSIPIVSGQDLQELNGHRWKIHGTEYVISSGTIGIDHTSLGGGNESWIVPLLDESGSVAWRFKTYLKRVTPQRARRIRWLCQQRVWEWSPGLAGAPREWIDTREFGRPEGSTVDFAGYLMSDVPGVTWGELRMSVVDDSIEIQDEWRRVWMGQLLRALVALENQNLVHGDLSPGNVLLSCEQPARLALIDFDSFVAPESDDEAALRCNGGMIGTKGYMPVDLERRRTQGDEPSQLTPYSDRRARDMLLLELACFEEWCPKEDPVADWEWNLVDEALEDQKLGQAERYFRREQIIDLPESSRASSTALARSLGVSLAPAVKKSGPAANDAPVIPPAGSRWKWDWAVNGLSVADQTRVVAKSILWSVCVAEWMLLALLLPRHIVPLDGEPGWILWLIRMAVQIVVGAAVIATGLWRTTAAACESEAATMVQLGHFQLLIPGSPCPAGSAHQVRHSAVMRLFVGAVLLGGVVLGVSRLSQV
ncbi:MAG: phosphotransferase [Planctomycetota bacterium]|jgi:hypothetical protein